jgi:hypothetical protein
MKFISEVTMAIFFKLLFFFSVIAISFKAERLEKENVSLLELTFFCDSLPIVNWLPRAGVDSPSSCEARVMLPLSAREASATSLLFNTPRISGDCEECAGKDIIIKEPIKGIINKVNGLIIFIFLNFFFSRSACRLPRTEKLASAIALNFINKIFSIKLPLAASR